LKQALEARSARIEASIPQRVRPLKGH